MPLRVYYPMPDLGPSIRRRRKMLALLKPNAVELVDDPKSADVQVHSVCDTKQLPGILCPRYFIYQHNSPATAGDLTVMRQALEGAVTTFSWADLPRDIPGTYPFCRLPQGSDPAVFRPTPQPTRWLIATTGFVSTYMSKRTLRLEGEPIVEVHAVAGEVGGVALQIGPVLDGITEATGYGEDDDAIARHYSGCAYVSGLRWQGGFECPNLEGLLCGCRPITFNLPDERFWWGDHAHFVEHNAETLHEQLRDILQDDPEPVSYAERDYLARKFGWKTVAGEFWAQVLSRA